MRGEWRIILLVNNTNCKYILEISRFIRGETPCCRRFPSLCDIHSPGFLQGVDFAAKRCILLRIFNEAFAGTGAHLARFDGNRAA